MPGPPRTPCRRSTSTSPRRIRPSASAASASTELSNTRAGPRKASLRSGVRSPTLTIPVSGASEPRRSTIAGFSPCGRSSGRITVVVRDGHLRQVLAHRSAGASQRVRVEHRRQPLHHRPRAARRLERLDAVGADGPHRGQDRHPLALGLERGVDVDVGARLQRDRLQVLDAVDRPRLRQHHPRGVAERARRQDLPRAQVLPHHVDDARARRRHLRPHGVANWPPPAPRRAAPCPAPRRPSASSSRCPSPSTPRASGSRRRPSPSAARGWSAPCAW